MTFLTHEFFRPAIEQAGIRFVPFVGDAAVHPAQFTAELAEHEPGPDVSIWYFERLMVNRMTAEHQQIQEELAAAGEPVVLVTDAACIGGWPIALGAPGIRPAAFIVLLTSTQVIPSVDADPTDMTLPEDTTEARARYLAMAAMLRDMFAAPHQRLEEKMAGLGVTPPVPFYLDGMAHVPDRVLQLCPPGFEYPRSDLPAMFRYAGVPGPAPSADELPSWWPDVVDAERVVVVTQGTLANKDHSALLEPAMHALAELDALVVVTTGGAEAAFDRVPANVRVSTYVPFNLLLPHVDVLVTNGGLGGVLQALSHGVPVVVAADSGDQPGVANRVEWTGTGINLHTGRPTDAAVREAVDAVLKEPSYRDAARRLQAEIANLDAAVELENAIAELTAHGTAAAGGAK
ncbi:nucleotide disphospho-sugar-binding domain-containing protein [Actinoplanes sp. NPDC049265]|uniref:nucleotide disphospho-sugar-binding domain-containing protein n=1 Tax=Actinoplanes sp. NPDC049265 TaxID=3363902 RepID=UPI00371C376A